MPRTRGSSGRVELIAIAMDSALYVYPWDVLDDRAAADEIASLGVGKVSLAAVYHTTRAISPHNPRRKIVNAQHAAVYFPVDPMSYEHTRLIPVKATWTDEPDPFKTVCHELTNVGQKINGWVVVCHSSQLGQANPDLVIQNAFGDLFSYALCPAQPEVRRYAAALISGLVKHYPLAGLELEACGYMGVEHLSHHDKNGLHLDLYHKFLFSLCFCSACSSAMLAKGLSPGHIREQVTRELESFFNGEATRGNDPDELNEQLGELLGRKEWNQLAVMRDEVTFALLDSILAQVPPSLQLPIILYAHSSRYETGACIGADLRGLTSRVDALMVALYGESQANARNHVQRMVKQVGNSVPIYAGIRAIYPDANSRDQFVTHARTMVEAGAQGIRYYHYGLCPRPNLAWIADAVRETNSLH